MCFKYKTHCLCYHTRHSKWIKIFTCQFLDTTHFAFQAWETGCKHRALTINTGLRSSGGVRFCRPGSPCCLGFVQSWCWLGGRRAVHSCDFHPGGRLSPLPSIPDLGCTAEWRDQLKLLSTLTAMKEGKLAKCGTTSKSENMKAMQKGPI